jgi:hypothetical protein
MYQSLDLHVFASTAVKQPKGIGCTGEPTGLNPACN